MKKLIKTIVLVITAFSLLGMYSYDDDIRYIHHMKRDLLALMMAYPNSIKDIEKNGDLIYIVMENGLKVLYDDKKEKTFDQSFFNPDIEDTLKQEYPLKMIDSVMPDGEDPGRIRDYNFLNILYGSSEVEVSENLTNQPTLYGNIIFNGENEAGSNLKKVLDEVAQLSKENPNIYNFVAPLSGTFNYRCIKDTGLLSSHAYGIAIDLKRDDSDYWKWCTKEKGSERIAMYPSELVEVFEKYGFVWGGKWSHFDILHYEYRPEIILKSRMFEGIEIDINKEWYHGVEKTSEIEEIIQKIDSVI